ncbi:hypothetical protein ACEPAI_7356 [Sanghuangporus weigelae]
MTATMAHLKEFFNKLRSPTTGAVVSTFAGPDLYPGVGLAQQMIGIGFVVANWARYCLLLSVLPLALQLVPVFVLLFGIHFLPFNPIVRSSQGTRKRGLRDHARRDQGGDRSRNIRDSWATPAMLKRTLVGCGVQIFGQFTGVNGMSCVSFLFGYKRKMYEALGFRSGKILLVQRDYGEVDPIAKFFFITLLLDQVARKRLFLFGAAIFVCTSFILTAIVRSFPPGAIGNLAAQHAGIAMTFLTSLYSPFPSGL